jgi:hypothetical protein
MVKPPTLESACNTRGQQASRRADRAPGRCRAGELFTGRLILCSEPLLVSVARLSRTRFREYTQVHSEGAAGRFLQFARA